MILSEGRPLARPLAWRMLDYCWGLFPALASLLLAVAGWQWVHEQFGVLVLPAPAAVAARIGQILRTASDRSPVLLTLARGSLAILLAIGLGLLLGFIAGANRTLALLFRPLVTLLLGMPPIVWVVLALIWFGTGSASVIFTVVVVVLPLVFASAQQSLQSVPAPLEEMLTVYGVPWGRRLRYLYLPHLVRQLLPALIVAVGSGWKVTIMAELLGSNDGIGATIASGRAMMDSTEVMSQVVIVVGVIMLVEYGLLEPLRRFFVVEPRA